LKKFSDALEDVNEYIFARIYIVSRLINASAMIAGTERSRTMPTKRRTPIPVKTAFAGENTCGLMNASQDTVNWD
jgi:hypothetical protein